MAFLTHATILLILACVSHQLLANGRKPRQARSLQPVKGKTLTKDKAECTWAVTGDHVLTMGLTCKKGGRRVSCEYVARPNMCPQYVANTKLFWKQIVRSLRKQKGLCEDRSAVVKAGVCKRAPSEAHFRLGETDRRGGPRLISLTPSPPTVRSCQRANKRLALEYCANNWSSFCTFFFTMVQDQDC